MLVRLLQLGQRLFGDRMGNAALLVAVGLPALIGAAGFSVDTAQWYLWKRELQYAVDQGALAGAWSKARGTSGTTYADHAQQEFTNNLSIVNFRSSPIVALATYNGVADASVVVTASATRKLPFTGMLIDRATTVTVRSQAAYLAGGTYTSCLIATNGTADGAITIGGSAVLTARCGLAALSTSTNAIRVNGSPTVDVNYVLAAGGIDDWFNSTTATVKEYMTSLSDPFKGLTPPTNNTSQTYKCNTVNKVSQANLSPGTYSNIITSCNTVMSSGIYVIDGGSFTTRAQDLVTGNGIMIVLKNGANIKINGGSALNLTAMTASQLQAVGVSVANSLKLEGMLVFEDPNSPGTTSDTINGNNGSVLNGTIYLPKSTVTFGGTAKVTSRCLQITANMIQLAGNTNMSSFCPVGMTSDTQVGVEMPKITLVS